MKRKKRTNLLFRLPRISWRITWYSVLIWFLAFAVGGLVILPWFYLVLAIVIFSATIFYFKRDEIIKLFDSKRIRQRSDRIFALGLSVSLAWFFVIIVLNILEIAGFYYFNFLFYFSDFRNWFLYPLVLLIPVVYSLILDNNTKKSRKRKDKAFKLPVSSIRHAHV